MAEGVTTAGSPLHTLTLLMSGNPHAVHAEPEAASAAEPSSSPFAQAVQSRSAALLSQWQGNLAIMAANRVAGTEAAMVKLGDRLWQERSQVCLLAVVLKTPGFIPVAAPLCLRSYGGAGRGGRGGGSGAYLGGADALLLACGLCLPAFQGFHP